MGAMFAPDGVVSRWMSKFVNIVFINVLWILCSLPVITIGASTTAMYSVVLKIVRDEDAYVAKSFFHSFAQNFKQATAIWLLILAYSAVILAEILFCIHGTGNGAKWFIIPAVLFAFIGVVTVTYVFPILSFFDDSIKVTIKNAFLMAVGHLPQTLLAIVINLIPVFILWFFSGFLVLATFIDLVIGVAFCAWLNARHFRKIFDTYIPQECLASE